MAVTGKPSFWIYRQGPTERIGLIRPRVRCSAAHRLATRGATKYSILLSTRWTLPCGSNALTESLIDVGLNGRHLDVTQLHMPARLDAGHELHHEPGERLREPRAPLPCERAFEA